MTHLNGMHAPDGGYSFNEQLINDVATGGLTVMDFQLRTNPHTQMNSNWECDNWLWLWAGCPPWKGGDPRGVIANPAAIMAIRMYQTDWREWMLSIDGAGVWRVDAAKCKRWAQISVEQMSDVRGGKHNPAYRVDMFTQPNVILWPCNEPDIEPAYVDGLSNSEHWYNLIGMAWLAWANEVDRLRPDRTCLLSNSPLAGGHDIPGRAPDEEYQVTAMREMIDRADILNAHVYGHLNQGPQYGAFGDERFWNGCMRLWRPYEYKNITEKWTGGTDPGGCFTQYPGKPKLISECGFFHHEKREWTEETWPHMVELFQAAENVRDVCLVTPFIWDSSSYHEGNRISRNESLRTAFRSMKRYAGAALPLAHQPAPPVDPLPDPHPEEPPVAFNPNPYGLDLYQNPETLEWGAIGAMLIKFKDVATTDEIRVKGAYSQIVWTMGASGRLYLAWQNTKEPYAPWRSTWIESGATVAARLAKAAA